MNPLYLGWRNLRHRPWPTALSLVLAALGAGLISLLLLLNHQLEQQFERNLAGIDLVVGAKGSPLQLILSSMYHLDAPTGNIPLAECKAFFNPRHPLISTAVPLALGDSHRGYRIVGATHQFLDLYQASVASGRRWEAPLEVVAGAAVAHKLGLQLGDTFQGSHGLVQNDDLIHADAQPFRLVGILAPTGSVADQLLLTAVESLWVVHDGHQHNAETEAAEADHADHDHADHAEHAEQPAPPAAPPANLAEAYPDRSITAILVQFKGRNAQTLNFPRNLNENTNLQAAVPAIEINRLYALVGSGERTLRALAGVIIAVSILSIFISLYSNLDQRRYELALLRVMGASRGRLFMLVVLEGVILATLGALLGLALSHGGMALLAGYLSDAYRYDFQPWLFLPAEGWLLLGAVAVGILAALLPAARASRTDIHQTLSEA